MLDYEPYERLRAAAAKDDADAIAVEWERLWTTMRNPCSSTELSCGKLDGHIPYDMNPRVPQRVPELFASRGIYVWGAWSGDGARTQCIGKADKQTLDIGRFKERYRDELRTAAKYEEVFRGIPEMFRAECGRKYEVFQQRGIRIPTKKTTRTPRASRYAKVGLRNLWHYVIPAPSATGGLEDEGRRAEDKGMRDVEIALIRHVSATLFASWRDRGKRAFPLLNLQHVSLNPLVDSSLQDSYNEWLAHGTWWREMNQLCGLDV